jgi:hypothetical protein
MQAEHHQKSCVGRRFGDLQKALHYPNNKSSVASRFVAEGFVLALQGTGQLVRVSTLSAFEPSSEPRKLALKRLRFCRSEDQLSDSGGLADAVQQSLVCVLKMLSCFLLSELAVACDER